MLWRRPAGLRGRTAESRTAAALADLSVSVPLGLRRLRARPLQAVGLAVAFGAAISLPAIGSATGALAHEENVELRLAEQGPAGRALVVTSRLPPFTEEPAAVDDVLAGFRPVTEPVRRVRVYDPVAPSDERGVRLVVPENQAARRELIIAEGRLPGPCRGETCEGLVLTGDARPGDVLHLGPEVRLRITGRGFLTPRALRDQTALGRRAVLVPRLDGPLPILLAGSASGVITSAVLDPGRVRGYEVPALAEAMRRAVVTIERLDSLDTASAPLPLLEELSARGLASRGRLALIAAQAAALILAFAAFTAAMRRRDTSLLEEQLATFGAGRLAAVVVRAVEVAVPAAAGTVVALVAVVVGTRVAGRNRGLPPEFLATALPVTTMLAVLATAVLAAAVIVLAGRQGGVRRKGLGPLDLAAVAALAVVVWQGTTTGALDPSSVGADAGPILLLLPALTFFVSAVILMRLLPPAFRLGELAARRAPLPVRLALLSATRRPAQAAAATTFLAVALGTAVFSLNYRTTLAEQARDEARFRAGAAWRVLEHAQGVRQGVADVSPLTRYSAVAAERPTPVLRLSASLHESEVTGGGRTLTLLGLPARRLPDLLGWRDDFSSLTTAGMARRLPTKPARLSGPPVRRDASALRLWVRGKTARPRAIVLHLLLPGQSFGRLELGRVPDRWRRIERAVPNAYRGSEIVGIEFPALDTGDAIDPGYVDFGGLEAQRAGGWRALEPVEEWVAAPSPFGAGALSDPRVFRRGPVSRGIRFSINGSPVPLLRPTVRLTLAAIVGPALADQAVEGRLDVDVPLAGLSIPLDVVGTARLFPTVAGQPEAFAIVDYDALFAELNVDSPGTAPPSEAWFFDAQPPGSTAALAASPFRTERTFSADRLERRLRNDPLAAGARRVLGLGALAAVVLGIIALVLATRTALRDEQTLIAEYEALGVPPRSLARSIQIRLVVLAALGLVAGAVGGFATVRLISALVAVTASATVPLPPIRPVIAWPTSTAAIALVGAVAAVLAAWLAGRELRRPVGGRLRG